MKIEIDEIRDLIFKYNHYLSTYIVTGMALGSYACSNIEDVLEHERMMNFRAANDCMGDIQKAIEAYADEKVRNEFREFHRWLLNSEIDEKNYIIIMKQLRKQVNKYGVFDRTEGKY